MVVALARAAAAAADLTMYIARETSKVSPSIRFREGFASTAWCMCFRLIVDRAVGIYVMGSFLGSVGMEEGDHGGIGGAAAPARQVGAPTRRFDFSGELREFIQP